MKHGHGCGDHGGGESHPVRVRGLKQKRMRDHGEAEASHPVRVRGLKPVVEAASHFNPVVAPRTGAWIETDSRPGTSIP